MTSFGVLLVERFTSLNLFWWRHREIISDLLQSTTSDLLLLKILKILFSFNLCWIALFFQNTKSFSQIWIKKSNSKNFCPHGNRFKKIDYFWNFHFQILVYIWQTTNEMISNKKKKALRRNTKELGQSC